MRFRPGASAPWIGNFQPGSFGGWQGLLDHPNGMHVIVVARGQGYVVDPEAHQLVSRLDRIASHVVPLPALDAIAISDGCFFDAINKDGIWWRSARLSWDEIRNIQIDGTTLRAESSIPTAHGDEWAPFTLDLTTGHCDDSQYIWQMRLTIPGIVGPSR